MKKVLSIALLSALCSSSYAGGYRISLQGNRQLGMGHTGVGIFGRSAESLFFNPASGVYLKDQWSLSGGFMLLSSNVNFQNKMYNWSNQTNNQGTPIYAYANYKMNDTWAFGLGVYTPYGSAVKWDQDWEGAHLVNHIDLKAVYVQPTVAVKITDNVSVGAGLLYVNGGVTFNRNISRNITDENGNPADVNLEATGVHSWGYTLGVAARFDRMDVGINYRSKVDMKATEGKATFHDLPNFMSGTYKDGAFSATMPLPAELSIGASYRISDQWLAAVDFNHTFWSAYENLTIEFENPAIGTSVNPRNYKDSNSYRVGLEYKASEKFTARIGGYYDETPVQKGYFAPETPRNESLGGTLGVTYQVTPQLAIDVSALGVHFKQLDASYDHYVEDGNPISFGGTYRSSAYSVGVGVSYNF